MVCDPANRPSTTAETETNALWLSRSFVRTSAVATAAPSTRTSIPIRPGPRARPDDLKPEPDAEIRSVPPLLS